MCQRSRIYIPVHTLGYWYLITNIINFEQVNNLNMALSFAMKH
uniref:Uncharacterized protein n=1 Tax=Anguilla anguilla TaxID=7936 RepID=A0A0E9RHF2_ANGAN